MIHLQYYHSTLQTPTISRIFLLAFRVFTVFFLLQPIGFSVSVVNGMISVVSATGEETVELRSRVNTYSDGRWHYISIMKMGLK